MPKKKVKQIRETTVEEKRWGHDDYYNIITVQVDASKFKKGDRVKITIEKIGDE